MTYRKPQTRRLTAVGLALILAGTSVSALAAGAQVSKKEAATIATQARPGKVKGEELTTLPNGQPAYKVEIQDTQGALATVVVDARTGEVLNGGAMADPSGSAPAQPGGSASPQ